LTKLERSLNKKLGEVRGEVDPVDLQNQVAKAVADTFAPFKQAVTTEVMTDVADLAGVYVTESSRCVRFLVLMYVMPKATLSMLTFGITPMPLRLTPTSFGLPTF
jgi:hypothetical protein